MDPFGQANPPGIAGAGLTRFSRRPGNTFRGKGINGAPLSGLVQGPIQAAGLWPGSSLPGKGLLQSWLAHCRVERPKWVGRARSALSGSLISRRMLSACPIRQGVSERSLVRSMPVQLGVLQLVRPGEAAAKGAAGQVLPHLHLLPGRMGLSTARVSNLT